MRLDRFISKCTTLGRAQSTKLVRQGHVSVNDKTARNPAVKIDKNNDKILLDGETLEYQEFVYIMLNKPQGYICSTQDNKHKTVLDLLPGKFSRRNPFSCGRLDIDTTGLVLITDNGKWSHRVTSPKKKCFKKYIVESNEALSKNDMTSLEEGVLLDGEEKLTLPAKIEKLDENKYSLQICEGKFHQIKRMFQAVDNAVVTLHRSKIGNIELDKNLQPGEFRELCEEEIQEFS